MFLNPRFRLLELPGISRKKHIILPYQESTFTISFAALSYDDQEYLQARAYVERFLNVSGGSAEGFYLAYQVETRLGADSVADNYRSVLMRDYGDSAEAEALRTSGNPATQ